MFLPLPLLVCTFLRFPQRRFEIYFGDCFLPFFALLLKYLFQAPVIITYLKQLTFENLELFRLLCRKSSRFEICCSVISD